MIRVLKTANFVPILSFDVILGFFVIFNFHLARLAFVRIVFELLSQSFVDNLFPNMELVLVNDDDCPSPKREGNDFEDDPGNAERAVVKTCRRLLDHLVDRVARDGHTEDKKKVSQVENSVAHAL